MKTWVMRSGVALGLLACLAAAVTVLVERESAPSAEFLGGRGPERALVLYHPSRDAGFSDDLSLAFAQGLIEAGVAVDRATTTGDLPASPERYDLVVVAANTYWWTPDLPTLRYLRRARFDGLPAVGIVGGAGATGRSERLLAEALRGAGGSEVRTRSYWLFRPNDENRMDEPNRAVAQESARRWGREVGEDMHSNG